MKEVCVDEVRRGYQLTAKESKTITKEELDDAVEVMDTNAGGVIAIESTRCCGIKHLSGVHDGPFTEKGKRSFVQYAHKEGLRDHSYERVGLVTFVLLNQSKRAIQAWERAGARQLVAFQNPQSGNRCHLMGVVRARTRQKSGKK